MSRNHCGRADGTPILRRGGRLRFLPGRRPGGVDGIARDPGAERRRTAAAFEVARVSEFEDEPVGSSLQAVAAVGSLERQGIDVEHAAAEPVDVVYVQPPADRALRLALPADGAAFGALATCHRLASADELRGVTQILKRVPNRPSRGGRRRSAAPGRRSRRPRSRRGARRGWYRESRTPCSTTTASPPSRGDRMRPGARSRPALRQARRPSDAGRARGRPLGSVRPAGALPSRRRSRVADGFAASAHAKPEASSDQPQHGLERADRERPLTPIHGEQCVAQSAGTPARSPSPRSG